MLGVTAHPQISGLSLHFYTDFRPTSVSSAESTPEEWYAVLRAGLRIEEALLKNWAAMGAYDSAHRIKFVVDEWGVWYNRSPQVAPGFNLGQIITLRDALHTAMHFDIFNRHADKIAIANVAQTINCLHSLFLAHEDKYARTPVYYVFDMYKSHMGAKVVPGKMRGDAESNQIPSLSYSASVRGKRMTVTLTNPSIENSRTVRLRMAGTAQAREANATVLTHPAMNAANTFSKPDEVQPKKLDATISGGVVTVMLPAKSVASVLLNLV